MRQRVADTSKTRRKDRLIKADQDAPYGTSWPPWTSCAQAGIEDMGLITERKRSDRADGEGTNGHARQHHGADTVVRGEARRSTRT